jgi:hypothetical protein
VMAAAAVVAEGWHLRVGGRGFRCCGHAVHGAVSVLTGVGHRTLRRRHVPADVSANRRKSPRHGLKRQHENKQQDEQTMQHASQDVKVDIPILAELLAERLK